MSMSMIYSILILDKIEILFVLLCLACVISSIVFATRACENNTNNRQKLVKIAKRFMITAIIFLILSCLIPTTKQGAAIWLLPKVVNNEQIQNITSNSIDIIDKKTQKLLVDLSKDLKEIEQ